MKPSSSFSICLLLFFSLSLSKTKFLHTTLASWPRILISHVSSVLRSQSSIWIERIVPSHSFIKPLVIVNSTPAPISIDTISELPNTDSRTCKPRLTDPHQQIANQPTIHTLSTMDNSSTTAEAGSQASSSYVHQLSHPMSSTSNWCCVLN